MTAPPTIVIELARAAAERSLCRSRRGVVLYHQPQLAGRSPQIFGAGHNGPPAPFTCPGRELCAGTCGKRCVHAEMRALRGVAHPGHPLDLVHVELGGDLGVVACDGPRCWQCSREILDVGFVAGVWLYELPPAPIECRCGGAFSRIHNPTRGCPIHSEFAREIHDRAGIAWRRYTAEEFHRTTLRNEGLTP